MFLVPSSTHLRPQAESPSFSLSLSFGPVLFMTPLFLYFLSITSLPLDLIKRDASLCCVTVAAPVNNSAAKLAR